MSTIGAASDGGNPACVQVDSPAFRFGGQSQLTSPNPAQGSPPGSDDTRESLVNDGAVGTWAQIQVPESLITSLRGILFDIDPCNFHTGDLLPAIPTTPKEFFAAVLSPWLNRHTVLNKGEVLATGIGMHVVIRFDKPIVFTTPAERERWAGIVKVVQTVLPVDPDQPGITALTRPVGAVNSKNGAIVELLKPGEPVTEDQALGLFREMCEQPFKTVMTILTGTDKMTPCPICGNPGTTLSGLNYVGQCYGSCGKVKLPALYDMVLAPRNTKGTEATDAKARK